MVIKMADISSATTDGTAEFGAPGVTSNPNSRFGGSMETSGINELLELPRLQGALQYRLQKCLRIHEP